jgi:hypothetical protein
VARWLGLGGVEIRQVPTQPTVPTVPAGIDVRFNLGQRSTLEAAMAEATFTVVAPAAAGPPTDVFTGIPTDGVTLVWTPTTDLPEVPGTGLGLLLTEFPWALEESRVFKEVGPDTTITTTEVNGAPAYWITGAPHTIYYDDTIGDVRPDTARLAGSTLLWAENGITYRLECNLDLGAALALAENLTVPTG